MDAIIGVQDVRRSAHWYEQVFGFKPNHGGGDFEVLMKEDNQVAMCLHRWDVHDHPTLKSSGENGNGLLLYFRSENFHGIRQMLDEINWPVEKEIALSQNSRVNEFALRDPDGYFIVVAECHNFGVS